MAIDTTAHEEVPEHDLEAEKVEVNQSSNKLRLISAAGVFLLYSYILMNEGAVRSATVAQPEPAPFSQTLLLVASCGEVVFGLAGILVGAALCMFNFGHKFITWGFLLMAFVLGWFVFVVWVIAAPIFNIVNTDLATIPETFTVPQWRTLQAMGMLGGVIWCFALQGGQFMIANVIATIQAQGKTKGPGYARARLTMWSVNALLSGLVFLIGAAVTVNANGSGPYNPPIAQPPIVMIYPELTIAAALIHIFFGAMGIMSTMMKKMLRGLGAFAAFTLAVSFAFLVWSQAWLIPAEGAFRIEPTTLLAGLSLVVVGNVAYSASEYEKDLAEN